MHEHHRAYKLIHWTLFGGNLLLLGIFLLATIFNLGGLGQFFGLSYPHAILGGLFIVYALLGFKLIWRRSDQAASFISLLFAVSLIASLSVATGGFMSPYYPVWLALILISSVFGMMTTSSLLVLTGLYFFYGVLIQDSAISLSTNVGQLVSAFAAGGFSYWLWKHKQLTHKTSDHVTKLSRQLSEEQLKSEIVLRSIGDGAVVVDTDGHIQFFNPAAEHITGWSEEEALDLDYKVVLRLLNPEFQPLKETDNPFNRAIESKKSVRTNDLLLKSRSDKKVALSLTVSPIMSGDEVSGVIAVFRDISAEKAAQRQRDEFISTASHEMRTPVASIEGYLALALNEQVSKIDDSARSYLLKAHEAVSHLGRLFQDLLSVTKLEDGKMPSRPRPVNLTSLVHKVIDELRPIAEKKQLKLNFKGGAVEGEKNVEPLYYAHIDPERIREVLTNLVDNAIKFTTEGEISITLEGNTSFVTVGVHDSGIGIAPEDIPHLFQKFYRTDNEKTRTSSGTGLGLYISRTLVELYGGRIWVESKPGEGSHFFFTLPRTTYESAQQQINQATNSASAPHARTAHHGTRKTHAS